MLTSDDLRRQFLISRLQSGPTHSTWTRDFVSLQFSMKVEMWRKPLQLGGRSSMLTLRIDWQGGDWKSAESKSIPRGRPSFQRIEQCATLALGYAFLEET